MWNKFLIWLGLREAVVVKTLEQLHADATQKAERALSTFDYAVAELVRAADNLTKVSAEADAVAKANAERAAAATAAAAQNLTVASKIKELIS